MSTWYDAGRRIGLHAAIAQLTARKQQLFEVYNASQIERICDVYDIKYHEAEACLAIVQQILEAKVSDTYQGPTANQPKKCPLPRIGSKEWGWISRQERNCFGNEWAVYTSDKCPLYSIHVAKWDASVYYEDKSGRETQLGRNIGLRDAQTLAEARARRDWRMENRGKK